MTSSPTHDHESSVWRWYKGQVWLAWDRWTFYLEQKTNKQNNYYNNNNKSTPSKLISQASKLIKYVTRLLHLKKEKKKERTILGVSSKKKKKKRNQVRVNLKAGTKFHTVTTARRVPCFRRGRVLQTAWRQQPVYNKWFHVRGKYGLVRDFHGLLIIIVSLEWRQTPVTA